MKKKLIGTSRPWAFGLAFSALTFAVVAQAALSPIGEGTSGFLAIGPAGLKIEGTGKKVSASEAGGKITVVADVANLKTGISLRDSHLKDAIHGDAHPNAKLVVERSALKFPEKGKEATASAKGQFTLNGVTKPISFDYKVKSEGDVLDVQGMTNVKITDFNIEQPCYLGVCVDTNIKVKVKFKVKD